MSNKLDALYSVAEKPSGNSQINPSYEVDVQNYEVPVASYDLSENIEVSVPRPQNRRYVEKSSLNNPVYSVMDVTNIRDSTAATGSTYSRLDHGIFSKKLTQHQSDEAVVTKKSYNKKVCICFLLLFIIVVACLVAAVVNIVAVFVLLGNLESQLKEAMVAEQLILQQNEMKVRNYTEFQDRISNNFIDFKANINGAIEILENTHNKTFVTWDSKVNNLSQTLQQIQNATKKFNLIVLSVKDNFRALTKDFSSIAFSNITTVEGNLLNNISNVLAAAQREVNQVTSTLIKHLQEHHVFNSCAAVSSSYFQFPSGMYNIKSSGGSSVQEFCHMTLSCGKLTGGWRRVINIVNPNIMGCPQFLTLENNSCRCYTPGCSSVYSNYSYNAYTHICGTVSAFGRDSPEGFNYNTRSIDKSYVDGVSITHGKSRNHVWTYAIRSHGSSCTDCGINRPDFVSSNFYCSPKSCGDNFWCDNSNSCTGNTQFYRQLESTTKDKVELRVCQSFTNDIILLLEAVIYVR